MPKWSHTTVEGGSKVNGHSGKFYQIRYGGLDVCVLEEWAFCSCAVNELYNMNAYSAAWKTTEAVDGLIEYLTATKFYPGSWQPMEFYFCVTPYQRDRIPGLVNHPCVKLIDKFKNKSHGDNIMHLYRLSFEKDFQ